MKSNDEVVEIKYNYHRVHYYKDIEPEFYNSIFETKESIYIRIVKNI